MDLESLLTDALSDRAGAVPPAAAAWEENRDRVRRSRRRRTAAAGTAAAVLVGGGAAVLLRPGPDQAGQRVAVVPTTFVDARTSDRVVAPPVQVGSVELGGREHAVVTWIAVIKGARPGQPDSPPLVCSAVAEEDGRVLDSSPGDDCQGPAVAQGGSSFVLEVQPLAQSRLPAKPCSFGPLGNLDLALVAPETTGVSVTTSTGERVAYRLVPGTESWPLRLFSATTPLRERLGSYRLVSGTRVLQEGEPPAQGSGCPKTGG